MKSCFLIVFIVLCVCSLQNIKTMDISYIENIPTELKVKIIFGTPLRVFLHCRQLNKYFYKLIVDLPIQKNTFERFIKHAVINEIKSTDAYNPTNLVWKKTFTKGFYEKIRKLTTKLYIPTMLKYCERNMLGNKRDEHSILNQVDYDIIFDENNQKIGTVFYDSSKNIKKTCLVLEIDTANIDQIQKVFEKACAEYKKDNIVRIHFEGLDFGSVTNVIIDFIQKYYLYDKIIEDERNNPILLSLCENKLYDLKNPSHEKLLYTARNVGNLYSCVLYNNQFDLLKILLQKRICTGLDFFKYISEHFKHINKSDDQKITLETVLTCLNILFSNNFLNPNLVYYENKIIDKTMRTTNKTYVLYTILQSGQMEIVKLWDTYKENDSDYFLYKKIHGVSSLWQAIFGCYPGDRHNQAYITNTYKQEISEFLLKKGVDPNEQTEGKSTPLHLARIYSPELLEIFLKYEANIFVKNNYNKTPLHHTVEDISKPEELEQYLEVLKKYDHEITIESGFNTKKYTIEKNNDSLQLQVRSVGQQVPIIKAICLN